GVFLGGKGSPAEQLADAIRRLQTYEAAGADGLFAPGLADPAAIAQVVAAVHLPLNVLAFAGVPPAKELERLGVARVSVGAGPMRATLALTRRIAEGVAAHSEFRAHPLRRLWRTLDLMLTLVFADGAGALRAVRTIEGVHARVHGVLEAPGGPFPRGTRYDANDPALLLWVYATLVDTALVVYERFVEPLGVDGRAAYYEGSKIGARLLGIPEAMMPPTFGRFQEYVDDMIRGDVLAIGPASREIAASILRPAVPL